MIQEIIKTLEDISKNNDNLSLHILGGHIVGATIAREDIDDIYKQYPSLEYIAELGAELETLENDDSAPRIFKEFQERLQRFITTELR